MDIDIEDLFVWKSRWFNCPKNSIQFVRQILRKMHRRTWCLARNWDRSEPNYLQLPGDDLYAVDGLIPYRNLNRMLHKAMHRLFLEWEKGYPFPSTYAKNNRVIPLYSFLIRGDKGMRTEKSYFCKFLNLALLEEKRQRARDLAFCRYGDGYNELNNFLDIKRLKALNADNTRMSYSYITELMNNYEDLGKRLPKDGWDFTELITYMGSYGITV